MTNGLYDDEVIFLSVRIITSPVLSPQNVIYTIPQQ